MAATAFGADVSLEQDGKAALTGASPRPSCARIQSPAEKHPPLGQRRLPADPGRALIVTATSYSWREAAHHRFGRLNACGTHLDETQISADWRFYPPGTVLWIEGLGARTVTDCGSAVRGPRHIDVHFNTLAAMHAWGTRRVRIRVLKTPARKCRRTHRNPFFKTNPENLLP